MTSTFRCLSAWERDREQQGPQTMANNPAPTGLVQGSLQGTDYKSQLNQASLALFLNEKLV